jgi:CBS-domain-containing membrane protein
VVAAVKRLEAERVKRLPVVDEQGRLVGIISRRDLLRMHLRPDPAIREEIAGLLHRTLHIDPVAVQVDVVDGRVTLTGMVDSGSTADLIVRLASDVAGVVEVTDKLAWQRGECDTGHERT